MNKTLTINLAGMVFHIDEPGFEKLQQYLNALKKRFAGMQGSNELIADIEARIAELFSASLGKSRQVISPADIEKMIGIMGKPEDFGEAADAESQPSYSSPAEGATTSNNQRSRRIFRDPDDKILGGVCSGLGSFFNIEPLWLRLAFAVTFLFFGSGLLFYLLLWIIIPLAKTTAEKIEMKGNPVNLDNIEKQFREEMEGIRTRMKNSANEMRSYTPGLRGALERAVDLFTSLLTGLGKAFIIFLGILMLLFGIGLLVVLFSITFGGRALIWINGEAIDNLQLNELLLRLFENSHQMMLAKAGVLLFAGIPILLLLFQGLRLLFKLKYKNRWASFAAITLWLTGLLICFFVAKEVSTDFSVRGISKQSIPLPQPSGKTLYLESKTEEGTQGIMWSDEESNEEEDAHDDEDGRGISIVDGKILVFFPNLKIEKSDNNLYELLLQKQAQGPGRKTAVSRSEKIAYHLSTRDSSVIFDRYFSIPAQEKWRNQKIKLVLKVPVGKEVYLDPGLRYVINDVENTTNTFDRDMVGRRWLMTATGLTCVDCDGLTKEEKDNQKKK